MVEKHPWPAACLSPMYLHPIPKHTLFFTLRSRTSDWYILLRKLYLWSLSLVLWPLFHSSFPHLCLVLSLLFATCSCLQELIMQIKSFRPIYKAVQFRIHIREKNMFFPLWYKKTAAEIKAATVHISIVLLDTYITPFKIHTFGLEYLCFMCEKQVWVIFKPHTLRWERRTVLLRLHKCYHKEDSHYYFAVVNHPKQCSERMWNGGVPPHESW